jgi:GMP synthase-like glutamine amidotransferase
MHKDIVYELPSSASQLASTDICENQGMYCKNRYITVQGHPEFTKEIEDEIIRARYKQGLFTDEMYEDGIKRLEEHDDGIVVAQAFLRFLLED